MLTHLEIDFLKNNIPFYSKLNKEEQEAFDFYAFHTTFKSNSLLNISENECTGLIIVLKGLLRVFLNSPQGKEITLYKLLDGDTCIFTASCIFNNIDFNINIEAIEDTEVIIVPSEYIKLLSNKNIVFQQYLLQLTQSKMSEVMWIMNQILFTSFDERLKNYLLEFNSSSISITHHAIAKDLGTAREVVSRMLKYFEKEGMIKIFRGTIEIIDLNKI